MSLRTRLLIATAVAAMCAVLVVDVATYVAISRSQLQQVDGSLAAAHQPVEELARSSTADALEAIPEIAPGTFVAILDRSGAVEFSTPAVRAGDEPVSVGRAVLRSVVANGGATTSARRRTVKSPDGSGVRLRIDPLPGGRTLIVGHTLHEVEEVRSKLVVVLVLATMAALALVGLLGWGLVKVGLKPLRAVEASARSISDPDLGRQRVPGANDRTEVGRVATALNAMLDRLEAARNERETTLDDLRESETRMRRFVADASHELRTPVAATGAYAELFEQGARDHPDDLARAMTGIRHETERMTALIEDLLLLAHLDEHVALDAKEVDLTELVFTAIDAARAIDPDRTLRASVPRVVSVVGDAARLRQVVDNLLANVRSHTPSGTICTVELRRAGDQVVLVVSDDGPGLSPEHRTHMFDRFYRTDEARSRAVGGSGLGLSIVSALVEAHGGSIAAQPHEPRGLSMVVTLPDPLRPVEPHPPVPRAARPEPREDRTQPTHPVGN